MTDYTVEVNETTIAILFVYEWYLMFEASLIIYRVINRKLTVNPPGKPRTIDIIYTRSLEF